MALGRMMVSRKRANLTISYVISLGMLLVALVLGADAVKSAMYGNMVMGTIESITAKASTGRLASESGVSGRGVTTHEYTAVVSYLVNDTLYRVKVNGHVLAHLGIIKSGEVVSVSYLPEFPGRGYALNYALFNPLVGVLLFFSILIMISVHITVLWRMAVRARTDG